MLGQIQTGSRFGLGIFGWRRVDLFGKDMLEDESAVVPDGIVFGILCEQGRRQIERLGSVFLCFDLDRFLACDTSLANREPIPLLVHYRPGLGMHQSA